MLFLEVVAIAIRNALPPVKYRKHKKPGPSQSYTLKRTRLILYDCPQTLNGFFDRNDLANIGRPGTKRKRTAAGVLRDGLFNGQNRLQFRQEPIHSPVPVHTELICLKLLAMQYDLRLLRYGHHVCLARHGDLFPARMLPKLHVVIPLFPVFKPG